MPYKGPFLPYLYIVKIYESVDMKKYIKKTGEQFINWYLYFSLVQYVIVVNVLFICNNFYIVNGASLPDIQAEVVYGTDPQRAGPGGQPGGQGRVGPSRHASGRYRVWQVSSIDIHTC